MIYIDPPYNTGNEFIYPDNFREGLQEYQRFTGQVDGDGVRLTTNAETDGRYHSRWLSMMYPRLFLARNLLREDGVIFVSIDDHEVHNLRLLMNEIFGEENFVATIIWQKVFSPKNTARHFSEDHDYVLLYARDAAGWTPELLPRTEEMQERYSNPDDDPRGAWASSDLCARNYYGRGTYSVTCPSGRVIAGPPTGTYWRISPDKFREIDVDGRVYWGPSGDNMPRLKRFLAEVKAGLVPQTLWKYQDAGHTQEAKKSLLQFVTFSTSDSVFDTPKPPRLIERMLRIATTDQEHDIVLDFFAGSGTTAQAVLELNQEDGGNRKFILVQLPEPTGKDDFPTIADITKERVRRVIQKLEKGSDGKLALEDAPAPDLGFRVFKLASSSFTLWDADAVPKDAEVLGQQLELYANHVATDRSELDILYELLLKLGLALTVPIEERTLAGQRAYSVERGRLLVCLEDPVAKETLRSMMELKPQQILCLDQAFHGDDSLKTNVVLEMKSHDILFHTV
ncbi:MAG TPA: site-specific DNA-methyltransferase [Armatimonadota bacterium]|nr:site-specific DNA-methyltransferase [Armatimonadota bacterium]